MNESDSGVEILTYGVKIVWDFHTCRKYCVKFILLFYRKSMREMVQKNHCLDLHVRNVVKHFMQVVWKISEEIVVKSM